MSIQMKWDHDIVFTLDDRTLLRAIMISEGNLEGHPDPKYRYQEYSSSAIQRRVLDKVGFKVIKENDHLRALLKGFLIANIAVEDQRDMVARERRKGFITRWFCKNIIRNLEADLKDLEVSRNAEFNKYEMLRRLTDWENTLLKRHPA